MSVLDEGFRGAPGSSRNRPHSNLHVLRLAVVLLFAILALRLGYMQIVKGSEYARRAEANHSTVTNITPARGLVYDRNGQPLVANIGVFTATVTPEFLPESQEERYRIYLKLEELVGVPAAEVDQRVKAAEKKKQAYIDIDIQKYLTKEQALILDESSTDMPGVKLTIKPGRLYVAGDAFSHILGYIGDQDPGEAEGLAEKNYQLNEPVGKSGLELRYEDDLRGEPGYVLAEQDAAGTLLDVLETKDPESGNSLKLAIDGDLQNYILDLLEATRGGPNLNNASVAAVVVMSPKTGEVYALVSVPTYDNNLYSAPEAHENELAALANDRRHPFLNQPLSAAAPGSTFKLVTAVAGLQEGNITAGTGLDVNRLVVEFKGENDVVYPFKDWKIHNYIDLRGAIQWSSNQYFYMTSCGVADPVRRGLGKNPEDSAYKLANYARLFGFGRPTGIDIGGEAAGIVPTPEWKKKAHSGPNSNPADGDWFIADTCFMGIGQGDVTATPLQIATMTAAIANGGRLLTPHVVKEVVDVDGKTVRKIETESTKLPIDPNYLAVIRDGMRLSVSSGAGLLADKAGYSIAGKTGTAEFIDYSAGGVTKEHAWFTGFAPFNDPEVVVTVYYDIGIGGNKAAPVAGNIIKYFMDNVQP